MRLANSIGCAAIFVSALLLWISVQTTQSVVASGDFLEKEDAMNSLREIWIYNRIVLDRLEKLESKLDIIAPVDEYTKKLKDNFQLQKKVEGWAE